MTTELTPQFDSRQSFYGKARVEIESDEFYRTHKLISYNTHVATVKVGIGSQEAIVNGIYSATTLRHIKEFLKQNGFQADSQKQIEHDYMGGQ